MSSSRGCSSWVLSHVEERNQQISITQNTETTTINLDGQSYVVSNPISDEIVSIKALLFATGLTLDTYNSRSIMTRYGKTIVWTGENIIRNPGTSDFGGDIKIQAYNVSSSAVPTKFITGNLVVVLPVQINIEFDPTGTSLIRTVAAYAEVYWNSSFNSYDMIIKNWVGNAQLIPLSPGQYARISFNATWTL